jgi:hypothetical protein
MKRSAVVTAVLLGVLAAAGSADARGPYGSINVGNWKGGAYTNDQTGEFSHCAAESIYQSGIYFVVMIDGASGWSLGFAHDSWTFSSGQAFPIALTFDGEAPFNVQDVVFRGFSSCEDSAGARLSQYFIVSRKKGGFVLFSVVSNMKTEQAKTVAKDERLADFRKAAWVVVNQ